MKNEPFDPQLYLEECLQKNIMDPVVIYLAREQVKEIFRQEGIEEKDVKVRGYLLFEPNVSTNSANFIVTSTENWNVLDSLRDKFREYFINQNICFEQNKPYIENNANELNLVEIYKLGKNLLQNLEKIQRGFEKFQINDKLDLNNLKIESLSKEEKNTLVDLGKIHQKGNNVYNNIVLFHLEKHYGEKTAIFFQQLKQWNIFEACKQSKETIVQAIVEIDSTQIQQENKRNTLEYNGNYASTPLEESFYSAISPNSSITCFLIKQGANVDELLTWFTSNSNRMQEEYYKTIFDLIDPKIFIENNIKNGNTNVVYPYTSQYKNWNLLQLAVYLLEPELVNTLLKYNFDLTIKVPEGDFKDYNLFHLAVTSVNQNNSDKNEISLKEIFAALINTGNINETTIKELLNTSFPDYSKENLEKALSIYSRYYYNNNYLPFAAIINRLIDSNAIETLQLIIPKYFKLEDEIVNEGYFHKLSLFQVILVNYTYQQVNNRTKKPMELIDALLKNIESTTKTQLLHNPISKDFRVTGLRNYTPINIATNFNINRKIYNINHGIFLFQYLIDEHNLDINTPMPDNQWLPIHNIIEQLELTIKRGGQSSQIEPWYELVKYIIQKNAAVNTPFPSGDRKNWLPIPLLLFLLTDIFLNRNKNFHQIKSIEEIYKELLELLSKNNTFDINAYFGGYTLLQFFIKNNFYQGEHVLGAQLVKLFIDCGANISLKTKDHLPKSSLELAKQKNTKAIYSIIEEHYSKNILDTKHWEILSTENTAKNKPENISLPENWQQEMFEMSGTTNEKLPRSLFDDNSDSVVTNANALSILSNIPAKQFEINDYANFKLPRAALHYTIIYLATKKQFKNDEEFQKQVVDSYNNCILKVDFLEPTKKLESIEISYHERIQNVINNQYSFDEEIKSEINKNYKLLTECFKNEEFSKEFPSQEAKEDLLYAMTLARLMHKEISKLTENICQQPLDSSFKENKDIKALSYKDTAERVTWIILGGSGSGKSSHLLQQIQEDIGEELYADTCRINPDIYRNLLITKNIANKFSNDYTQCSEYVHEESSFISKEITKILQTSIEKNSKGPNVLFDAVKPDSSKNSLGSYALGTCYYYIASCLAKDALLRAYLRFSQDGRPMPAKSLLIGHQKQGLLLESIKSGEIFLNIFNTNVEKKETAPRIAFSAGSKELVIEYFQAMLEFVSKEKINVNAKSLEELEKKPDISTQIQLLMKYVEAGFTLKLCTPNIDKPFAVISPNGSLTIFNLKAFMANIAEQNETACQLFGAFVEYQSSHTQAPLRIIILATIGNKQFQQKILVMQKDVKNNTGTIISCVEHKLKEESKDLAAFIKEHYTNKKRSIEAITDFYNPSTKQTKVETSAPNSLIFSNTQGNPYDPN